MMHEGFLHKAGKIILHLTVTAGVLAPSVRPVYSSDQTTKKQSPDRSSQRAAISLLGSEGPPNWEGWNLSEEVDCMVK